MNFLFTAPRDARTAQAMAQAHRQRPTGPPDRGRADTSTLERILVLSLHTEVE